MARARIFVVDDEPVSALDLEQRRQALGGGVVGAASTGAAAIAAVEKLRPDLVFADISLPPTREGFEAADEIRHRANIPVVHLAARSDEAATARAKMNDPYAMVLVP